ncbi:MAG: cation-translocating P-type ATPase [Acidimicrobiales bacterium]
MSPVDLLWSLLPAGRHRRRAWSGPGKAHIEVRGSDRADAGELRSDVEGELVALDGVRWAKVEPALGRVIVSFDEDQLGMGQVLRVIEQVEAAHGVQDERFGFDRPEHPGDSEPSSRELTSLAADAVGLAGTLFGHLLTVAPLPQELASLVSLVDSQPRLRRLMEDHLGHPATDLGLALATALGQALALGPLGLAVDTARRALTLAEARARLASFELHEPELWPSPGRGALGGATASGGRPSALGPGPVESYADRAGIASLAAFGLLGAATLSPRKATAAMLAGTPKAARVGREAYAAQLGRALADRGVTVMDPQVLRRLDRVDCLVLDAALLSGGRHVVTKVVSFGDMDRGEAHKRVRALFDPLRPDEVQERRDYSLGPLDMLGPAEEGLGPLEPDERQRLRELGAEGGAVIGLTRRGRLVAAAATSGGVSDMARQIIQAAHAGGQMVVIAGAGMAMVDRLGADLAVEGGPAAGGGLSGLAESVRTLQSDGCGVLLVTGAADDAAMAAADCSVQLLAEPGSTASATSISYAADILAVHDLELTRFIVEAAGVAHEVSRQSVALALVGSAIGSFVAIGSPPGSAVSRALVPTNLLAAAALANGVRAAMALSRRPPPRVKDATAWHEIEPATVLDILGSSSSGLDAHTALRRRDPPPDTLPGPVIFAKAVIEELANPLTPVLAGGAALSAAVGSTVDAAIVAGVTVANAMVGGAQRYFAYRSIERLDQVSSPHVDVLRPAGQVAVPADQLVPGDVVCLVAGSTVPADCRILAATALEVDESSLTGESLPVPKDATSCFTSLVAERSSMLYEGTSIAAGEVTAVVVATGMDTELGAGEAEAGKAPSSGGVEARLRGLTSATIPLAFAGGVGVVAGSMLRGGRFRDGVGSGVSLAVAAVPEGLPLLATMAQLAAARRLSQRGALVRNPRAIEALGRVEFVCTDKTGTLTAGRMELDSVSDGRTLQPVASLSPRHRAVLAAGLRASPQGPPESLPHLTDRAVVRGGELGGTTIEEDLPGWQRLDELPFEPGRGYHATLGRRAGMLVTSVKGAPEVVIPRCSTWRAPLASRSGHGDPVALDGAARRRLLSEVDKLARRGLRLLAVAEASRSAEPGPSAAPPGPSAAAPGIDDAAVGELELLGFLALADPVRPAAASAVSDLGRAGIRVVMVTGDHPSTAEGIAAELGILNGHRVVSGGDLAKMSDEVLDAELRSISVFARVTPADKVRIVSAFQRAKIAVAMTGDGANDAAAIRLADVGVALGAGATPAARQSADLVVTDERIETLTDAVVEGRAMWGSVRDALAILLGGNLGEVIFTVAASLIGGRAPLSARQLLLVNLLTDVAPALAIAVRPPRRLAPEDLLAEGPDRSLGTSLERDMATRAIVTASSAGVSYTIGRLTGRHRRASTMALATLVGAQLGQTLVTGGGDRVVTLAAIGSAGVLAAIVQTPGVSRFFGCTPLGPVGWGTVIVTAAAGTAASVAVPALGEAGVVLVRRASTMAPIERFTRELPAIERGDLHALARVLRP